MIGLSVCRFALRPVAHNVRTHLSFARTSTHLFSLSANNRGTEYTMTSAIEEAKNWPTVKEADMKDFMKRCMLAVGTKDKHAEFLASVLIKGDTRGHYSHGLNRLDMYVKDILQNIVATTTEPEILKQNGCTALVSGNNCLGPVVGSYCMDIAIQKAKENGVGWVCAKNSNHFGICAWYTMKAAEQGLVGFAFTNTSPFMVPTRSREHGLGTNPICCAAKGTDGKSFVLDMASTAVAQGKLEIAERRGQRIPDGWGCDGKGKQTNDPAISNSEGGCLPLGGMEENGGYKGYGLAMMVELLCGIMSGSTFGKDVRIWRTRDRIADLGQCYIAVDPGCFAPGFDGRLTDLIHQLKGLDKAEGETEILIPGEPEERYTAYCEQRGGVPYHPNQIKYARELAAELDIEPPAVQGE